MSCVRFNAFAVIDRVRVLSRNCPLAVTETFGSGHKGKNGSNQVLYCLSRRGPDFDLIPWMKKRAIPLMAYSPLDQGGLLSKAPLKKLAAEVGCTPAQLALAWLLALPGVVTIQKSSTRERVKENFGALDVKLSADVMAALDKAFPPPKDKQSLQML